ncbi:unnamed protein product [Mytilus edulis]|uniref:Uncharacterized protein n=1 Tax=Mytilus edulis TaxID=6550 RepID=A0A8S3UL37_MYTED|nr:unnamed protein product [Mytilus edulis]
MMPLSLGKPLYKTTEKTKETICLAETNKETIKLLGFQELLQLPGIGIKTGEQIMDIREGKGFVTESDLATISHLRVTMALLSRLDFNQNGGGQNSGPPPEAQGTGVGKRSVNEILVTGQNSAEVGFLDEIPVADPKPADEGICISRVTVATVGRDVVIVPDDPECSIRVVQDGLGGGFRKYSVEQICDAQSKDPEFKWLTEWLDDNSCQPAQGDLFRSSQPAKFYWTIKERFSRDERGMIIKDGCPVTRGVREAAQKKLGCRGKERAERGKSPRGRHHDRVPSVERVVPSQGRCKGSGGEFEAKVLGKDISGDHRDSSPKARDTGSGLVRGTRDGSHDSRARSGNREGTSLDRGEAMEDERKNGPAAVH